MRSGNGKLGSRRLKIAIFNPVIPGRGGAETILTSVIDELQRRGDECRLYIFGGTQHKEWLKNTPWWIEVGQPTQPRPLRLVTYFLGAVYHLLRWKPDAIVACDPTTVRLAHWARALTGRSRIPLFSWLFCSAYHCQQYDQLAKADAHICMCQERAGEMRSFARHSRLSSPGKEPVFVAYCGTFDASVRPVTRSSKPVFAYVGRIHWNAQKRTNDLIEAAAKLLGDFEIKLVGDGPEQDKAKLRELIERTGLGPRVEWLGWRQSPWSAVPEASLMVQPSQFEGYSMVMIEALAVGLPVVASEFGGISREVIVPGQNGWLYPVGDVDALGRILQNVIDRPETLPTVDAVQASVQKFSKPQMAADFRKSVVAVIERMSR